MFLFVPKYGHGLLLHWLPCRLLRYRLDDPDPRMDLEKLAHLSESELSLTLLGAFSVLD